jgi:hypothetical protein
MTPHETKLFDFLQQRAQSPATMVRCKRTIEQFVLEYGWWYKPVELPEGITPGKEQECHKNAVHLTMKNLIYCEGYAIPEGGGFPVIHAWVTDDQGRAIDNTWQMPGVAYAGVPFMQFFVGGAAIRNHAAISLLDDWKNKWPLGGDLGDRPNEWLDARGSGVARISDGASYNVRD